MPQILNYYPYASGFLFLLAVNWLVRNRNNQQALIGFVVACALIFFPSILLSVFLIISGEILPLTALTFSVGYGIFVYPGTNLYWP